jgi:hypothetical protein
MRSTARTNGAMGRTTRASQESVKGVFHDRDRVKQAVRQLTENSIPADSIRVFILDATGRRRREVAVEQEAGALEGAVIGAVIGSVVAVIAVVLVSAGVFGPPSASPLGIASVMGALSAIALGIAVGVPLGSLFGMGHWQGWRKISEKDVTSGHVEVVVESEELAALARRVLDDAGADR